MPTYTIYTFNNNEVLAGLFNGIASMVGANGFKSAIAIMLISGFIAALMAMVFAKDRLHGVKWLFAVVVVNSIFLVPKATVSLIDLTGAQPPKIIANVPWGLAAQASIVSSVGKTLTGLFETTFQTVSSNPLSEAMSYSKNGMMFGSKLISSSRSVNFSSALFRANMINFVKNCTFYDLSQKLIASDNFISKNNDIWPAMASTNKARFSVYDDGATVDTYACDVVYSKLNAGMAAQETLMQSKLAVALFPRARDATGDVSAATASALMEVALPDSYARAKLGTAAASAATLLRQNAILNAATDAVYLDAQSTNDPTAALAHFAKSQATAALNAQYVTKMALAQETLPLLRNSVEAIIYALFPFVILLAMMFGGMAAYELIKQYSLGLIWVSLWAPLYAVTNYLATFNAERNLAAAGFDAGASVGLTISTANSIYSTAVNQAANVGDLMLAVPAIAGALVFGLAKLANVAAGSIAATSAAAGAASNPASSGNLSSGNVSMDKLDLSASKTSQDMSVYTDAKGATTRSADGTYRYQTNIGTNTLSLKDMQSVGSTASQSSTESEALSRSKSREAATASVAAFTQASAVSRSASSGTTAGTGTQFKDGSNAATQMRAMREITEGLSKDYGITESAAAKIAFGAQGGLGTGSAMPFVQAQLKADGSIMSDTKIAEATKRSQAALEKAGITNTNDVVQQYAQTDEFKRTAGTNNDSGRKIEASLAQSTQLRESAKVDHASSQQYARIAQNAEAFSRAGEQNWTNEYNAFLNNKGIVPGNLTPAENAKHARAFLASGDVREAANGERYIIDDKGAGADNKTPLTANSFANPAANDARFGTAPLVVNGQAIDANSIAAQNAVDKKTVAANNTVNQAGMPTETSVNAKGSEMRAAADQAQTKVGAAVNQGKTAREADAEKAIATAPTQKLDIFNVTERTRVGMGDAPRVTRDAQAQQDSNRARGVVNPDKVGVPPPGTPGPNPN